MKLTAVNRVTLIHNLLLTLAEECGEVIVASGKIGRFGTDSSNPLLTNQCTNWEQLYNEVHDVLGVFEELGAVLGKPVHIDRVRVLMKREKLRAAQTISQQLGLL